ncbi:unnamed protein product, partial [Prorocentrum cordatum]
PRAVVAAQRAPASPRPGREQASEGKCTRPSDAKTCPAHAGAAAERGVDLALARRRARPLAIRRGRGLRARRRGWRGLKRVSRGWVRRRRGQEEGEEEEEKETIWYDCLIA